MSSQEPRSNHQNQIKHSCDALRCESLVKHVLLGQTYNFNYMGWGLVFVKLED